MRIRSCIAPVLAAALLPCAAANDAWSTLERLYGRGDLVALTGTGRLTVGVNARGRVNVCRWPTPSYNDQLTYDAEFVPGRGFVVPESHGLMWGMWLDDPAVEAPVTDPTITWWSDERIAAQVDYVPDSSVIEIRGRLRGTDLALRQYLFVDPDRDVLVSRLEWSGSPAVGEFYWYTNYSPCTRRIPELPGADFGAFDARNDFACFSDPETGRLYHMRPTQPDRARWDFAEMLVEQRYDRGAWGSLGEGVYVGGQLLGARYLSTTSRDPDGPLPPELDTRMATVGQAAGLLGGGQGYSATAINAFGPNLETVHALLDKVSGESYETLRERRRKADRMLLGRVWIPETTNVETAALLRRCVLLIRASTDSNTGAVVRSPASQPPLARDWPRHGAWVTYALDIAGLRDEAQQHVRLYLDAVRRRDRPGQPIGSLPASLYTDGLPASPHVVLDAEAVAWLLWSLDRHAAFLSETDRTVFVEEHWPRIYDLAEFLAGWKDHRRGAPLHSFDPAQLHDAQTRRLLTSAHAGIHAAIALATHAGRQPEPPWTRHAADLDILMQNIFLDDDLVWPAEEPLPLSLANIDGIDERGALDLLGEVIEQRLSEMDTFNGRDAARTLAELAILARGHPAFRERVAERLDATLQRVLRAATPAGAELPAFPDSVAAAQCYVAAGLLLAGT